MVKKKIHQPSKAFFSDKSFRTKYLPYIICDSLSTPENYGNIIRLAANIGCKKTYFLQTDDHLRISKIKKTASSSFHQTHWEFVNDINKIREEINSGYRFIAIETHASAKNIYTSRLPEKAVFMIGNEKYGISEEFLKMADVVCYIPVPGITSSLNVSHSLAVALFEWYRQVNDDTDSNNSMNPSDKL